MTNQELIDVALRAREKAYAPYSSFRVGAALLGKSGRVYSGCNIENAGYTPTNCAERTALFKAISEGEREFVSIAIVGGRYENIVDFCPPCGVCRQTLAEFCDEAFRLILWDGERTKVATLGELFPLAFGKGDVQK